MNISSYMLNIKTSVALILCASMCETYTRMFTEDDKLCSPITKRRLLLDRAGAKSALYISQKRLQDHAIDWSNNFECKFEVKAPRQNGIVAVIQYLSLRRNKTSGECIDYVQFSKQYGPASKKFCDLFNAELQMDSTFAHVLVGPIPNNSFIDDKGVLDVRIFVSKYALSESDDMDIRIALTTFRNCRVKLPNDKECSKYEDICIDNQFFNDGVYNCPFYDCQDEGGCEKKPFATKKESLGNKVLIASLSSLLITFVLFICCLWICRVHKLLCWAQGFANPQQTANTRQNRQIELLEQVSISPVAATATTSSPPQEEEDKDLPPSYDSLFPSR